MNVAVLIAGIADPKWPLDAPQPRIFSPFDESALEVALKLRDADPATTIAVLVAGDEALGRSAASYRPDHVRRVAIAPHVEWDFRAQALAWKSLLAQLPVAPDLVVVGRELGDRDDGTLPPCLAEALGWPFAALVQQLRATPAGLELMRERGSVEEIIERAPPVVASITNDRRNKLRHPLMKNVMAARRATIEALAPEAASARVVLEALDSAPKAPRASQCRMLDVEALAQFLRAWRAAA